MLDFLAKRYGKLPSEVMKFGDSLDMRCAVVSTGYESYLNKKEQNNESDNPTHGYSKQQLQEMINKVRARNGSKS